MSSFQSVHCRGTYWNADGLSGIMDYADFVDVIHGPRITSYEGYY